MNDATRFAGSWVVLLSCLLASGVGVARPVVGASAPSIEVAPAVNLPHGIESVLGSGFDPGSQVDISVRSSLGSSRAAVLTADPSGSISASITLPYTLDAGLANMVVAQ